MIAERDLVAVRATWRGTDNGAFMAHRPRASPSPSPAWSSGAAPTANCGNVRPASTSLTCGKIRRWRHARDIGCRIRLREAQAIACEQQRNLPFAAPLCAGKSELSPWRGLAEEQISPPGKRGLTLRRLRDVSLPPESPAIRALPTRLLAQLRCTT